MQLGLQHTDAGILSKINRGCTAVDAAVALRRLKDACFKVVVESVYGSSSSSSSSASRWTSNLLYVSVC